LAIRINRIRDARSAPIAKGDIGIKLSIAMSPAASKLANVPESLPLPWKSRTPAIIITVETAHAASQKKLDDGSSELTVVARLNI
jgi:hypothetical protein